jgi:hypothetical protein
MYVFSWVRKMSFDISMGPMKLKMRCHSGTDCTTTAPVTVQSNDVSFGFKTTNTYNTNRTTGNFQCIIDIKCIDFHSFLCLFEIHVFLVRPRSER